MKKINTNPKELDRAISFAKDIWGLRGSAGIQADGVHLVGTMATHLDRNLLLEKGRGATFEEAFANAIPKPFEVYWSEKRGAPGDAQAEFETPREAHDWISEQEPGGYYKVRELRFSAEEG